METFSLVMGLILAVIVAVVAGLVYATPALGPRGRFMGVKVDDAFASSGAGTRIRRTYRGMNLVAAVVAFAACIFPPLLAPDWSPLVLVGAFVLVGVSAVGTYVWAHGRTLRQIATTAGGAASLADERHWKWGLIYYNPADPAVEVAKRFGAGRTLNLARRQAWLILAIPLGFAALIVVVVSLVG